MRFVTGLCQFAALAIGLGAAILGATMIPEKYDPNASLAWATILPLWASAAFAACVLLALGSIAGDVGRMADRAAPTPPPTSEAV